jgi:hypothetical protein
MWKDLLLLLLLLLLLFNSTANGFLPGGSGTTIIQHTNTHTHKITHHSQTKHITQSYTHNEGHITQNEYNAKI